MEVKYGSSRTVLLTKNHAFKLPYIGRWKNFLWGLIANMNEVEFNTLQDTRLAKILFYLPAGFLVVMKRAKPLNDSDWDKEKLAKFIKDLPVELKRDSFGYIDGKLKAIDYG